jgi:hypothetical protein
MTMNHFKPSTLSALSTHLFSDRILWIAIVLAGLVGGAYAACSGPAPSERYVVGPDPDEQPLPRMPKPAPTAYAFRMQDPGSLDAGPLVAMASR